MRGAMTASITDHVWTVRLIPLIDTHTDDCSMILPKVSRVAHRQRYLLRVRVFTQDTQWEVDMPHAGRSVPTPLPDLATCGMLGLWRTHRYSVVYAGTFYPVHTSYMCDDAQVN